MKKWVSVLLLVGVAAMFGQAWYLEKVDTTGDVGLFTSLAIDSDKLPHIAYYDATNQILKYAYWDSQNWIIEMVEETTPPAGVGRYASLVLGLLSGDPHVAYYDSVNTDLKYATIDELGEWSWGIAHASANDVGQGCDIAVGEESESEVAHISYYDATAGYLLYSRYIGTIWSRDTVDSVGPVTHYNTSIVLDGGGKPHVAYYAVDTVTSTGYLKYAYMVSGEWMIDTVEMVPGNDLGLYPDLALNENEGSAPYISYFDATNGFFKYARWTGSAWTVDVIDNNAPVGEWGSQVLGTTHTSYYDGADGDLKYAYTINYLTWRSVDVDTAGDVGAYTSIGLTHSRDGELAFPHISYYDITNGDLKYATRIIKDVLPINIVEPLSPISPEESYTPTVTVRNQSNTVVSFDVGCEISYFGFTEYQEIVGSGPLEDGEESEVVFPTTWSPEYEDAWYYIKFYTMLPDDSLPANDTIFDSLYSSAGVAEEVKLPSSYMLTATGQEVKLSLPALTKGELFVLDVAGRRRATLNQGNMAAGVHTFNLEDLPSGVYFIKYVSEPASMIRKTVLVH